MVLVFATCVLGLLLIGVAQEMIRLRRMPYLTTPAAPLAAAPRVSLLIPARNEAHTIRRCLDGALHQTYEPYEVIVVDDGSSDATPAILAEYARRSPHLRVLRNETLATGWTGKAFACQQAATAAQGEWLLFLDADTVPHAQLVAAVLAHAQREQCDLLTVFPFLELRSFWERTVLPAFRAMIYGTYPFARLNANDTQMHEVMANGQCLLIRRALYAAIGGHGAVRSQVLEDVHLARAIHQAGGRVGGVIDTGDHVQVRMYTNGREVLEGLTKNAAAGYRSGGRRALWVGARLFFLALAPIWLLVPGLLLRRWSVLMMGGVAALAALASWRTTLRRLYRLPGWYALLWPVGLHAYGLILLRSMWRVQRGQGVTWKGRTYVGT
jgi:glycosyltransferase involved in cell wall biosynthesis